MAKLQIICIKEYRTDESLNSFCHTIFQGSPSHFAWLGVTQFQSTDISLSVSDVNTLAIALKAALLP